MSPNQRIVVNVLATYGRTLVGVLCGIFSTRWVLMALGHEKFGLFGVVGSLVLFVSFINIQFSAALSRFYAYSIGKANATTDKTRAISECREWFTTGVMIHTILPLFLVALGYPLGKMAITTGWLTIPASRIETCLWLWRFSMISCFISMINVPFQAMFTAKQYIAELTAYSLTQVLFRTGFVYYMTTIERDWLLGYGCAMCIIAIVPQMVICVRALKVFPECRMVLSSIMNLKKIKQLASYAWWQAFGGIGYLARHQCLEIIVNKIFGPKVNAAYTVGSTVGGEAAALTGALNGAFGPAVTTAYGEGNMKRMTKLAYTASKFGTLLTMVFAVPIGLEISEVLKVWLKNPPEHAESLCLCWLVVVVLEKLSLGQGQAVRAVGKVAWFQLFRGTACLTAIPLSMVTILICRQPYMVCIALIITTVLACLSDVFVARLYTGLSARYWLRFVVLPLCCISIVGIVSGLFLQTVMAQSFVRLVVLSFCSISVMFISAWNFLFDTDDRLYLTLKVKMYIKRLMAS